MATTISKSKPTTNKPATAKPHTKPNTVTAKTPEVEAALQAAVKSAASHKLVNVSDPDVTQVDLKKKELIDMVVDRSGIKKKDAKPVIEAMLAVLGETIASGRELNLQPFGKLRINRAIDKANGMVFVCKLRQSDAANNAGNTPANDPLAEAMDKL